MISANSCRLKPITEWLRIRECDVSDFYSLPWCVVPRETLPPHNRLIFFQIIINGIFFA